MAETFNFTPDYGASKRSKPRVRTVEFGSGYSQRVTFGINQDPKVWTLSFENRTSTEADNIEDFLEARKGVESFNWSPPDDTDTYRWICREWQKTLPYSNLFTITATFEQVFEA